MTDAPLVGSEAALEQPRQRSRTKLVAAGAATALVLGGGGFVAAKWYLATGPQPAEALPATTLAYLAFDLDPSGEQLLEARRIAESFPAWDDLGIGSKDDLREWAFDELMKEAPKGCRLDFEDDVDDWLGDRVAIAAVPGGKREPFVPVVVVQVKDKGEAEKGVDALNECDAADRKGKAEPPGMHIGDEWAVFAETQRTVDAVVADTEDGTLADDETFQELVEAAGGAGFATGYAAPEAGPRFLRELRRSGEEVPTEIDPMFESFGGAALRLSADDGAVEARVIVDADAELSAFFEGSNALPAMELLPDGAPMAVGLGLDEGWGERLLSAIESMSGPDAKELRAGIDALEDMLGARPEELLEQALGESAALVFGEGMDERGEMALVISGDVDEIEKAIKKVREAAPGGAAPFFEMSSNDDVVVVGPTEDFREELLDGGGLTDSEAFKQAVPDVGDASMAAYVDLSFEPLAAGFLSEFSAEERKNMEKLSGFGMAQWQEGRRSVTVIRVVVDG